MFSCSCSRVYDRNCYHAIEAAMEDCGLEKVLSVGYSDGDNWLTRPYDKTDRYVFYIIGEINDEEVIVLVPSRSNKSAIRISWIFDYSFKEIIRAFENYVGYDFYSPTLGHQIGYDFVLVDLVADEYFKGILGLENYDLDVEMGIEFNSCFIVQSNGELVFFTV